MAGTAGSTGRSPEGINKQIRTRMDKTSLCPAACSVDRDFEDLPFITLKSNLYYIRK
jgi:hypothetical protein